MSENMLSGRKFESPDSGPVVTGLLTQRGLLIRDSESFGGVLWGPIVNLAFPTGPRSLSFEPEKTRRATGTPQNPLPVAHYEKSPRALALRVHR